MLVALLRRPAAHCRGYLELLWDAAYENGEEYLGPAALVEHIATWDGEPGGLVAALVECGSASPSGVGFIELDVARAGSRAGYRVHDLWDHAPDYVRKRFNRELQRRETGSRYRASDAKRETDRSLTGHCPPLGQTWPPIGAPPAPAPAPAPAQEEGEIAPRPLVSAPAAPPADDLLLFEFPCDGETRSWQLRASKVAEWQESYPALDVLAQCRQALQYIRDNPAKRKTARGMPAFLGRWLARSQDSSRGSNGGRPARTRRLVEERIDPDAVDAPEPSPPGAETPSELLWRWARERLEAELDREEFYTWFAPLKPVPGEKAVVWCPNPRFAATIEESYGAMVRELAGGEVGLVHG